MTRVAAAICWPAYICWTSADGYFIKLGAGDHAEYFDRAGNQMQDDLLRKYPPRVVCELGMCEDVGRALIDLDARYRPVGYDLIYLADNEWGNRLMDEVAQEWFSDNPECEFVQVNEHAGWHLCYRRDGSCWGSANDCAQLNPFPRPSFGVETCMRRETGHRSVLGVRA